MSIVAFHVVDIPAFGLIFCAEDRANTVHNALMRPGLCGAKGAELGFRKWCYMKFNWRTLQMGVLDSGRTAIVLTAPGGGARSGLLGMRLRAGRGSRSAGRWRRPWASAGRRPAPSCAPPVLPPRGRDWAFLGPVASLVVVAFRQSRHVQGTGFCNDHECNKSVGRVCEEAGLSDEPLRWTRAMGSVEETLQE